MKSFILIFSILASSVAFASAPTPNEVFAAILKDSGLSNATQIVVQQYGSFGSGQTAGSRNNLLFNLGSVRYACPIATFHTHEIGAGHYFVDASVGNCRSDEGRNLVLDNDYTTNGISIFTRAFYDNNSMFRFLSNREQHDWTMLLLQTAVQNRND